MKQALYLPLWLSFWVSLFIMPAQASVDIQTWQTSNGAKVLYVYAPELPMVDVELLLDAGSARDGKSYGLAALTNSLIGTQTPNWDENALTEKLSALGVQLGQSVGRDSAALSFRSLTRTDILNPGFDLFVELATQAQFNPAIVAREKARLTVALQQKQSQPSALMGDALWAELYGEHPYAHPVSGSLETIDSLTAQQLEDFYRQYYVAANAQVTLVGAVSRAQARTMAERLTRSLATGEKPRLLPQPGVLTRASQKHIPFKATQTQYRLAQLGVQRGDPDYYALFLGNHLLGGSGFGSLLMEEVREKRGLVYGVSSGFYPMKVPGPFLIGLSTQNASIAKADQVVKATLEDFMKGFSEEKLADIKSNLMGGFPLRIDSNAKILGYVSMIGFYDLPLDYLEQFPKKMAALDKARVLAAWQKRIHPDTMLTLTLGMSPTLDTSGDAN
ncbi:MAG: insulinase family protein [Piscirickettsiaceae bacterium CG_4_9_14_3_um_filter_43_564]|nr:insulinase family protein [Thiomicrospira sp.]OIP94590.1 MAG: peptidase M16 [Thiomicrospira sp. CG2_30_44_34]PIQ03583.1 MAG: peptidase M16 [Piscirickettsiaceae bacterium CG18_big_fil_WC_8_21_14_2_50_44_103]PIU38103.1 MAG: insulinase family protein [Piscirickettsiaceae bacterium CG07_land_8_20_14_0_80_44_28]PIW56673.1 MAG: insulinase family protein [Piscirickettsiaceae bacterium CG12_big_fil_rev_8_21_14_0_65_44_934]PIW77288.1 MAG: insulinase family protein [Piscirickettsiaceae bacterium CG_4